jgi:hypothetical protein
MAVICLLTDRNEMRNLNRGPSIDAPYQLLVHLTKRLQRRKFLEIFEKQNCLWRPCMSTDWDEMDNLNRRSSIDASYQVSV